MENKMYLVTGAAGFLGSTICRQLVEQGEQVRAFVLPNDRAARYLPEQVEVVEGDLCNQKDLEKFVHVLVRESGCKPIKMFLPIKMAYAMATIMEKNASRKGKKPVMTKFSVYNLARNNVFDSSKARRELGYTTRSYEETIKDEVQWLKKEGMIE